MHRDSAYQKRYEIACEKRFVTWEFLRCGYVKGLVGREQIIDHAIRMVANTTTDSDSVVALAGADTATDTEIQELLTSLSAGAVCSGQQLDRLRLCVLMQTREMYAEDPIQLVREVDDIYSMFDYPEDMRRAVSYMPVEGSVRANIGDVLESPITALDEIIYELDHQLTRVREESCGDMTA